MDDATPEKILVYALLPFLMSFVFIFYIFLRRKRESDIQKVFAEIEMKALRAQMNPHFIFNSLNSIHLSIQNQNTEEAGDYLLKFSKLMRRVLENSRHKSITLSEDLDTLKLYLELESKRKAFSFSFQIAEEIDPDIYLVPPLILQPFIENSIIHGFANKQQGAEIVISVALKNDELIYCTEDNGNIAENNSPSKKHNSLGTVVTKERLELLRISKKRKARFEEINKENADGVYQGKKIIVYLPIEIDE
ncbi:MAG: histidine kinase [Flavobacteriales bacterium]